MNNKWQLFSFIAFLPLLSIGVFSDYSHHNAILGGGTPKVVFSIVSGSAVLESQNNHIIPDKEQIKRNLAEITKNYIYSTALISDIDPFMAVWIAQHESRFDFYAVGDTDKICLKGINKGKVMRSRGIWQINSCAWPRISDEFAFSISSSTQWAMEQMKKNPNIWSVWKFRKIWFASEFMIVEK